MKALPGRLVPLRRCLVAVAYLGLLVGLKPRPRSGRLREAIERLLVGSADEILEDLRGRVAGATDSEKINIREEGCRMGATLAAHFQWDDASRFYELALSAASSDRRGDIAARLAAVEQHREGRVSDSFLPLDGDSLDENPSVDSLRLPGVWIQLVRRTGDSRYFREAAAAADAINDRPLATWARKNLLRMDGNAPDSSRKKEQS